MHSKWWSNKIGEARSKIEQGKGDRSEECHKRFKSLKGDYNKYTIRWSSLVIDPMHDFQPTYVVPVSIDE